MIYFFIIFHWGIVDLWLLYILLGLRDVESLYPKEWEFLQYSHWIFVGISVCIVFWCIYTGYKPIPHKCPQGLFNIEEYVRTLFVWEWQNQLRFGISGRGKLLAHVWLDGSSGMVGSRSVYTLCFSVVLPCLYHF